MNLILSKNLFGYQVWLAGQSKKLGNFVTSRGLQDTREKSVVIVTSPAPPKINIISNWKYFYYWAFDIWRQTFHLTTMLIVCRLCCYRLYTYMIYLTCILNDFFQCSKQQRPFISFLLQLLQSIPHRIVWFKNPRLILDMKVNGIEMLFSRFSDKDCMKISIKCLKKYLSLIQSGYSNFVLTEGFLTPLF